MMHLVLHRGMCAHGEYAIAEIRGLDQAFEPVGSVKAVAFHEKRRVALINSADSTDLIIRSIDLVFRSYSEGRGDVNGYAADVFDYVIEADFFVDKAPVTTAQTKPDHACTCDISTLMSVGCRCGGK